MVSMPLVLATYSRTVTFLCAGRLSSAGSISFLRLLRRFFLEQLDEQFHIQSAFVGAEPDAPLAFTAEAALMD